MSEQAAGAGGTGDLRREQLMVAALEVISERGYPDTRIADVAERAGTSPALVIYYFKTKDRLLTEAMRYAEERWYRESQRRMAALHTAAGRLEEMIAMMCLPEADADPSVSWLLWLDFWAQAARHPEVAGMRQKSDERWRELIASIVLDGQEAGEFADVNPVDFAASLCAMLDGFSIQIALEDPDVDPVRAFELSMRLVAHELGFDWAPGRQGTGTSSR